MTIRFAAAWRGRFSSTWQCSYPGLLDSLCPSAPLSAGNDNPGSRRAARPMPLAASWGPAEEDLLADALRHFARHGLGAAAQARRNALAAIHAGEHESAAWWIEICRQLDRRMAATLDDKLVS